MDFTRLRQVGYVGYSLEAGLCHFLTLSEQLFDTIIISHIYLVLKSLLVLYLLSPLPLLPDLVLLLNNPTLTILTLEPHLGPFKRSKPPSRHMMLLSMPLFVILSKSDMMSSEG